MFKFPQTIFIANWLTIFGCKTSVAGRKIDKELTTCGIGQRFSTTVYLCRIVLATSVARNSGG